MKRFWILFGAFVVTAVTLGLALLLGTWGFEYRRLSQHEGRLRRVMEQEPDVNRLTEGLANEGTVVLAAPETPEDLERTIATYGDGFADILRQKADRWPAVRVYRATDMLYFVFFDEEGVMKDFVCLGA